jgi:hypothetical protein
MLRSEYCLARAERLRMLMLTASDPASARRLRGFVQKYRDLAERAKKQVESPPLSPQFALSTGSPMPDATPSAQRLGKAARIKCVRWRTLGKEDIEQAVLGKPNLSVRALL